MLKENVHSFPVGGGSLGTRLTILCANKLHTYTIVALSDACVLVCIGVCVRDTPVPFCVVTLLK